MQIMAIADFHGKEEIMDRLMERIEEKSPDIIVFAGDVVKGYARGNEWLSAQEEGRKPDKGKKKIREEEKEDLELYNKFYGRLSSLKIPVMCIPGNMDAPEERFFSEMLKKFIRTNIKVVQENIFERGGYLIGGIGGEITKDSKERFFVLQYLEKEARFALRRLKYAPKKKILLLHSPPKGKLDLDKGKHKSEEVINEIISEINPEFVFCGHAHKAQGEEKIGNSLVINPGALKDGNSAMVDTKEKKVEFKKI